MRGRGIRLLAPLGLVALLAAPLPALAQGDIEAEATDEQIGRATKALRADEHESEKVKKRLEDLKRQNEDLDFKRRTKAPFRSERSLRHDLRTNEAQQGWQKHEERRLEYELRRQEQEIRNRTQDWRRSR